MRFDGRAVRWETKGGRRGVKGSDGWQIGRESIREGKHKHAFSCIILLSGGGCCGGGGWKEVERTRKLFALGSFSRVQM